jgi:hypothetical protein
MHGYNTKEIESFSFFPSKLTFKFSTWFPWKRKADATLFQAGKMFSLSFRQRRGKHRKTCYHRRPESKRAKERTTTQSTVPSDYVITQRPDEWKMNDNRLAIEYTSETGPQPIIVCALAALAAVLFRAFANQFFPTSTLSSVSQWIGKCSDVFVATFSRISFDSSQIKLMN